MKVLLFVFLVISLLGCGERRSSAANNGITGSDAVASVVTPETIQSGLDKICSSYEAEQDDKGPCEMDAFKVIGRLSDATQRLECVRYYVNKLFRLQLDHLSYSRQSWVVKFIIDDVGSSRGYFSQFPGGWEERYDVELRLLEWQKEQIERVKPKRRVKDPYAYDSRMSEKEFQGWCMIYYGGMDAYESRLRNLEGFLPVNKRRIPDDEWGRIVDKVEKYLGRPIRTKEQLRRDFKEKKRMVYTQKRDDCDRP